jgi:hypothetical protein
MEPSVYGLLGVVVVWVGTIVTVWLKTRQARANGVSLTRTSSELGIVLAHAIDLERAIIELKEHHRGEVAILRSEREQWQLRALACEERERGKAE